MSADIEDAGPHFHAWADREGPLREALLKWYHAERRQLPWRGDPAPWSEKKAESRKSWCKELSDSSGIGRYFKQLRPARQPLVIDLDEDDGCKAEDVEIYTPSAYGVWVSEVMLQQTQVEVVIPYWTRWMRKFPTLHTLAAASAEEVNAHWAGLGFYGRARRLHEGAQYVVAKHDGTVPSTVEALRQIPGVGPYTAGAIASIAFGKAEPLVDGNVARVFSRLCGISLPAKSPKLLKMAWQLAGQLVDPGEPGAFNQGLMELGATVCTPSSPSCDLCPLRFACRALELVKAGGVSSVTDFPQKAAQKKRRERTLVIAAVTDGSTWMLVRRPNSGLLAGQLEFPCVEITDGQENPVKELDKASKEDALQKLQELMLKDFNLSITLEALPGLPLEHIFSHERHVMHIFQGRLVTRPPKPPTEPTSRDVLWLSIEEAEDHGVTSGLQKVFGALTNSTKRRKRHQA